MICVTTIIGDLGFMAHMQPLSVSTLKRTKARIALRAYTQIGRCRLIA